MVTVLLTGCSSTKQVVGGSQTGQNSTEDFMFLRNVSDNFQYAKNITAKIKFTLANDGKEVSLSGSLKMRRDDAIQIQLTALGLMEIARIELTPDYIMLIDRYHRKYVKENYNSLEFLRENGLNFYSMQALFWNELFCPGQESISESKLELFRVMNEDGKKIISLKDDAKPKTAVMKNTEFKWGTDIASKRITSAQVRYGSRVEDSRFRIQDPGFKIQDSSLVWSYDDFTTVSRRPFPAKHVVGIKTNEMKMNATVNLSKIDNSADWESRTTLSGKYTKVSIEELIEGIASM